MLVLVVAVVRGNKTLDHSKRVGGYVSGGACERK